MSTQAHTLTTLQNDEPDAENETRYIQTHDDRYPPELLDHNQWIVYAADKTPLSPKNLSASGVRSEDAWTDFQTARGVAESTDRAAGVGFVFTDDDDYVGVDLDHCIDPDGTVSTLAWNIIQDISSYTELSPSGDGLHIIAKGSVLDTHKQRDNSLGIEIYDSGRYFTVTGQSLIYAEEEILDREDMIHSIQYGLMDPTEQGRGHSVEPDDWDVSDATAETDPEDVEMVDWMCDINGKFDDLHNGRGVGYESDSEADIAYLNQLAWLTGKDPTQMERIARSSSRVRQKWDAPRNGSTWIREQIAEAISFTSNTCDRFNK